MVIRYSRIWGSLALGLGLSNLMVNFWSPAPFGLLSGSIVSLLGVLWLTRPYLKVSNNELEILTPLGVIKQRHPIKTLEVVSGKLYITSGNSKKKIAGFVAHKGDWEKLLRLVENS